MSGLEFQPYFTQYAFYWPWIVLGLLPPLLILLYFLKLRRRPLEVPSTFLWHRTIEDLHVNAIWQRLRQSLLLLLQLLFFALIAMALVGPGCKGREQIDARNILLFDTSASMSASDVGASRLEEAKKQAENLVNAMSDGAVAMIISFSDTARVEQTFTSNKNILRDKIRAVRPTAHTSSLDEALRAAAGLANPGRTGDASEGDVPAAAPEKATMYVFTDGGFRTIPNFAQGVLSTKYMKIGEEDATKLDNVAITGFSTERNPENGKLQAFARLENYGGHAVTTDVSLFVNGEFRDAKRAELPAREMIASDNPEKPARPGQPGAAGVDFDLQEEDDGVLWLEIDHKDQLPLDNTAYAVLNSARPARILVATGSESTALRLALSTDEAQKISQTTFVKPSYLEDKKYQDDAASGVYDLIIYDRCAPKVAPQANTLFLGIAPPFEGWPAAEPQGQPDIIDVDRVHPLTQLVDLSNVFIGQTLVIRKPKGGLELVEADVGPVYTIAPRQSFEDAALGFSLFVTKDGEDEPVTNWPRRRSFPVFVMNAVKYLGGTGSHSGLTSVRPGMPYPIRTVLPVDSVSVKPPNAAAVEVRREGQNVINFSQTDELGIYEVREGSGTKLSQQFSVNLFDMRESDLFPAPILPIGNDEVQAESKGSNQAARKELWRWILLVGLAIILFEWYIYNRRVYL